MNRCSWLVCKSMSIGASSFGFVFFMKVLVRAVLSTDDIHYTGITQSMVENKRR